MKLNLTIEARMTSSRLPGKVNLPLKDGSMLEFLVRNIQKCKFIDKIILATTTNETDDILVDCADKLGIYHFRGSESNVLKRVSDAHRIAGADVAVLLTADNPFVTCDILEEAISEFLKHDCDYLTNSGSGRKYPDGLDVVVMKRALLEYSLLNAQSPSDYEHVCNVILKSKIFKINNYVNSNQNRWFPDASITVDTASDFFRAKQIVNELSIDYTYEDLLAVIKKMEL
jgi:spore coat polysaccharide biosynthesis protein SpsF